MKEKEEIKIKKRRSARVRYPDTLKLQVCQEYMSRGKKKRFMKAIKYLLVNMLLLSANQIFAAYVKFSTETNVTVNYTSSNKTITEAYLVFQNSDNENIWYYLPKAPRLYESIENGKAKPEFSFVKYSIPSKNQIGKSQGGILQFSVSSEAPPEAVAALLAKLRHDRNNPYLQIAPISSTDATVTVYLPVGNGSLDSLTRVNFGLNNNLFPLYSTQKASYTIPLTKEATDIILPILKTGQRGGIEVSTQYTIAGRVEATIKATVHWDKLYDYLYKNTTIRAEVGFLGFFGASYSKSVTEISQKLQESGCLDVSISGSETMDSQTLYKYWEPIANVIANRLLEKYEPSAVPAGNSSGGISDFIKSTMKAGSSFSFSGSYGFTMLKQSAESKGDYTINMSFSDILKRKVLSDGFVSLKDYDQNLIDESILVIDESQFKQSILTLPTIPSAALINNIGLVKVNLTASLHNDEHPQARHLVWDKQQNGNTWKIVGDDGTTLTNCNALIFNSYKKDEVIDLEMDFQFNDQTIPRKFALNLTNDVITNPDNISIALGSISFDNIQFVKLIPTSNLRRIYINSIVSDSQKILLNPIKIEPIIVDNVPQNVKTFYFLIYSFDKPLMCDIQFEYTNADRKNWKYNGTNLKDHDETRNYQIDLTSPN